MGRHGQSRLAGELFLHRFDNVVRHERFAVVLANVSVGDEAGFAAQVAGELAAVVVLDDDGVACALQNVDDRVAVQRDEPADLQLIGRNALLVRSSQASSITP